MIAVFTVIKFQDDLGLRRTNPGKKRVHHPCVRCDVVGRQEFYFFLNNIWVEVKFICRGKTSRERTEYHKFLSRMF